MEYALSTAVSLLVICLVLGFSEMIAFICYIGLSLVEISLVLALCLLVFHTPASLLLLLISPWPFLFLGMKRGIVAISTNIGLKISIALSCWITIQAGLAKVPSGVSDFAAWTESAKNGCGTMSQELAKFFEACSQCHTDDIVLPALTATFFLVSSLIIKLVKGT